MRLVSAVRSSCVALAAVALAAVGLVAPANAGAVPNDLWVLVVSPQGDPVPGAVVFAGDEAGPPFSGVTDAAGRVVWHGAPAEAVVCAEIGQTRDLGGPAGWATTCNGFTVSGPTRGTLRFHRGAAITGNVTDARTGTAVANADVRFFLSDTSNVVSTRTDRTGHYLLRNLASGRLLYPTVSGGSSTRLAPYGYAGGNLSPWPVLTAGRVLDVPFRNVPNVRYTGTVVDGAGAAISGASVLAVDEFGQTTVATDVSGAYQVDRPWTLGSADQDPRECAWATASAAHPTGRAAVCTFNLTTGVAVNHPFVLAADGAALVGKVVDRHGGSPGPIVVAAQLPTGAYLPGVAGAGGTYRIDGVPAGTTVVRVSDNSTQPSFGAVAFSALVRPRAGIVTTVPDIVYARG